MKPTMLIIKFKEKYISFFVKIHFIYRVFSHLTMVISMSVRGSLVRCMEKGDSTFLTGSYMRETSSIINFMGEVSYYTRAETNTKENGKKASNMGWAFIRFSFIIIIPDWVSTKKVNSRDGFQTMRPLLSFLS